MILAGTRALGPSEEWFVPLGRTHGLRPPADHPRSSSHECTSHRFGLAEPSWGFEETEIWGGPSKVLNHTSNLGKAKGGSFQKNKKKPIGSGGATLIWTSILSLTFLLKSLVSLHGSIEISSFSSLFYWNLYFLFTFLLISLLSLYFSIYFSIEISTFSLLFFWNLYFLFTFVLKSLLSLNFSIEISTFSLLFDWNLYFLFTFLLKSLLSLNFSIEISTFSLLFDWNLYFLSTFLLKSLLSLYFSFEISAFSLPLAQRAKKKLTQAFAQPPNGTASVRKLAQALCPTTCSRP